MTYKINRPRLWAKVGFSLSYFRQDLYSSLDFLILSGSLKKSLLNFTRTGLRAMRAIRLGKAMRPFRIFAIVQARPRSIFAPKKTKIT